MTAITRKTCATIPDYFGIIGSAHKAKLNAYRKIGSENTLEARRISTAADTIIWYWDTGRASYEVRQAIISLSYRKFASMIRKMASTPDWTTDAEVEAMLEYLDADQKRAKKAK